MHIDIVPNRNSSPAVLLRESYRVGDKVRKRTLANLSKLPMDQVDGIRQILKGRKLVPVEEVFQVVENGSRPHGHVRAVLGAMDRLGFARLIGSRPSRERDLVVAMVAARILQPRSKLATTRWWHTTTLPNQLGVADADEDELYAAMDWLVDRQDTIEKKLAARHLHSDGLALYDLSSSYFEGTSCPLGALGYSRDGKKGKQQVNYGLLSNQWGVPVALSVFEGNTGDTTTLLPQVEKVRDAFGIERFVLVGDRGMITQKQINTLRGVEGLEWITALRSEAIRKLVADNTVAPELFDERSLFEIENHPDFPNERLIACRNADLARRRAEKRKSLLEATSKELRKVQQMVQRGRLRGKSAIEGQLSKALASSRLGRHVQFDVRDDGFDVRINEDGIAAEATRTTVAALHKVRDQVQRGRIGGKDAIRKRIDTIVGRRKLAKHIQLHVRDDDFDFSVDAKAVAAEAVVPLQRKLDKVRQRIARGSLHGKDAIGLRAGRVINKYKVAKHFVLDIRSDCFDFHVDEQKVAAEAALDGIYIVRTSLATDRMDADQTVRSYKLLTQVERAFRSFKTIDLKVRPIFHTAERRVRAHIFLCMLAYYVQWHMIEAWRPLLFCDEDQPAKARRDPVAPAKRSKAALAKASSKRTTDGDPVHSFQTLLLDLTTIVRNICRRAGATPDEPTFEMITPANAQQQRAYDLLSTISV